MPALGSHGTLPTVKRGKLHVGWYSVSWQVLVTEAESVEYCIMGARSRLRIKLWLWLSGDGPKPIRIGLAARASNATTMAEDLTVLTNQLLLFKNYCLESSSDLRPPPKIYPAQSNSTCDSHIISLARPKHQNIQCGNIIPLMQ
jgi:hypothetical protein